MKSNRVRWVGHAARIKVKIIHNFGHKTLKKKSHPEFVSVEIRWKDNIKLYRGELSSEAVQCFSFAQLRNQRCVFVTAAWSCLWHKMHSTCTFSLTRWPTVSFPKCWDALTELITSTGLFVMSMFVVLLFGQTKGSKLRRASNVLAKTLFVPGLRQTNKHK